MVSPIEHDLHIGDLQFAMLTGGAFGILYTVAGIPLGWLADRYPPKWIVAGGIAWWSVMTAGCGLAGNFPQLFATRIGVGVGEATLSPCAYSMISDLFDRTRITRALGLYTFGIFIGAGLATILGGEIGLWSNGSRPRACSSPTASIPDSWYSSSSARRAQFWRCGWHRCASRRGMAGRPRRDRRRRPRARCSRSWSDGGACRSRC